MPHLEIDRYLKRASSYAAATSSLMSLSVFSAQNPVGRLLRCPLNLVPPSATIPILMGKLRGKRWIAGSGIHSCWIGIYEYSKQQLISDEVCRDTVFYDIGANVGFYSLLASGLVGEGMVYAFEPLSRNLRFLEQHLFINQILNVKVLPVAVSDLNGQTNFVTEETGFMGRLSAEGDLSVKTVTLDELVDRGTIRPPNYIKMDIEGAELRALRGGIETFRRFRPVLFIATHGKAITEECQTLLESWGYDCRILDWNPIGELGEFVARFRQ